MECWFGVSSSPRVGLPPTESTCAANPRTQLSCPRHRLSKGPSSQGSPAATAQQTACAELSCSSRPGSRGAELLTAPDWAEYGRPLALCVKYPLDTLSVFRRPGVPLPGGPAGALREWHGPNRGQGLLGGFSQGPRLDLSCGPCASQERGRASPRWAGVSLPGASGPNKQLDSQTKLL